MCGTEVDELSSGVETQSDQREKSPPPGIIREVTRQRLTYKTAANGETGGSSPAIDPFDDTVDMLPSDL